MRAWGGAQVDARGCPLDSDGIPDGLDRCSATPAGAIVDALAAQATKTRTEYSTALTSVRAPRRAPPPIERIARLRADSYGALDSIATILHADTTMHVEIGVHTDNAASPSESQRLTTLQAEAVRLYLIEKGLRPQQIAAKGYGSSAPIAPNTTQ